MAGVKYDHSLFWFYYDSIYIFLKLISQLGKYSMDIFGNWNSFHVEDGQYRQKCYSHCSDRCFKKHQSLLMKGSGCLHQFHLEVWWHLVTISAVPEWTILLHWPCCILCFVFKGLFLLWNSITIEFFILELVLISQGACEEVGLGIVSSESPEFLRFSEVFSAPGPGFLM